MSMTCKICRHNERKPIEHELIQGEPLRDIARRHKTSKDAVQRHRGCFAEMYDRGVLAANTVRLLNLRSELERAISDIKRIREAAFDILKDPHQPGRLNLSRRSALDAAKLLLQASDRLDKHLRMLGDLTGEFKQPQRNERDVTERLYNEWIGLFEIMWMAIDPKITRRMLVETLAEMPETTAEFMPFVLAELNRGGY